LHLSESEIKLWLPCVQVHGIMVCPIENIAVKEIKLIPVWPHHFSCHDMNFRRKKLPQCPRHQAGIQSPPADIQNSFISLPQLKPARS